MNRFKYNKKNKKKKFFIEILKFKKLIKTFSNHVYQLRDNMF